ncbi:hypothetical protein [Butyrivibrio virus Arian]|nr:hypothetical protein [Butyrivibrio virus Arian]
MANYSLNIYGENDEIIKTFETNIIRWGIFMKAVKLQDDIEDQDEGEQIKAVSEFITSIFPNCTVDDLANADVSDIFNLFRAIVNKANKINIGIPKNA